MLPLSFQATITLRVKQFDDDVGAMRFGGNQHSPSKLEGVPVGGGRVKYANALFYCYFQAVSCHSERSEESDNVCFMFLLMFTDSSLRSE